MSDTIEVPISLIKSGDMDAIRELLPQQNLFGRRATHFEYGRGIIFSICPDEAGLIRFAYESKRFTGGTDWECVYLKDLTLDPVELTILEDFENAPLGTVVEAPRGNAYQKTVSGDWESWNDSLTNKYMATCGSWKILRRGWGE